MDTKLTTFRKMMKNIYKRMHDYDRRITHAQLLDLCQDQFPSETCTNATHLTIGTYLSLSSLTDLFA